MQQSLATHTDTGALVSALRERESIREKSVPKASIINDLMKQTRRAFSSWVFAASKFGPSVCTFLFQF